MLQYAAKVVAFTFIVLFAVTFFGRSFLQFLDVSVAGQSLLQSSDESSSIKFDPFTGKNNPLGPKTKNTYSSFGRKFRSSPTTDFSRLVKRRDFRILRSPFQGRRVPEIPGQSLGARYH